MSKQGSKVMSSIYKAAELNRLRKEKGIMLEALRECMSQGGNPDSRLACQNIICIVSEVLMKVRGKE